MYSLPNLDLLFLGFIVRGQVMYMFPPVNFQVDVEVIDVDRNGIMLGKLYVADSEHGKNARRNVSRSHAFTLVQEGLAWVDR